jgi:NAD-dependent SIR2 family protein deacetylase
VTHPTSSSTSSFSPRATTGDEMAGLRDRWVVRYLGEGEPPAAEVALIQRTVQVLDRTDRMLLVEGTSAQVASLARALPTWKTAKERLFTLAT